MDNNEYNNIIQSLVAIKDSQNRINNDLRTSIKEFTQLHWNHQTHLVHLDTILVHLDTIIKDIKTLLAHDLPLSKNGRDV